jgi:hypothetical protein
MSNEYLIDQKDAIPCLESAVQMTINQGVEAFQEWVLTEDRIFCGLDYYCENFNKEDTISLEAFDSNGNLLRQYAKDLFLRKEKDFHMYSTYFPSGIKFVFTYKNNGSNVSHINFNLNLHKKI